MSNIILCILSISMFGLFAYGIYFFVNGNRNNFKRID